MSRVRKLVAIIILCFFFSAFMQPEILAASASSSSLSMERIGKQILEDIKFLQDKTEELKYSLPTGRRLNYLLEHDIPPFMAKIERYQKQFKEDEHLVSVLANLKRYSDTTKVLWTSMNVTSLMVENFLIKNVYSQLNTLNDKFIKLVRAEPDRDNSQLSRSFIQEIRQNIDSFLDYKFTLKDVGSEANEERQMTIGEFIAHCKVLVQQIIEHEKNSQIVKKSRKRRAATDNDAYRSTPCTSVRDWIPSPVLQVIHHSETITFEIPITVTFAVFTIEQLYASELVLKILLLCYDDDLPENTDIEDFIKKNENELATFIIETLASFGSVNIKEITADGREATTVEDGGEKKLESVHAIWMCDPTKYYLGENVLRFSGVFQTCIEKETALNENGKCSGKCNYYKQRVNNNEELDSVKARFPSNHIQLLGGKRGIYQKLSKCKRLEDLVKICPSNVRDVRYQWFSTKDETFGKKDEAEADSCRNEIQTLQEEWRMEAGSPIMKAPQFCEICLCSCNYLPSDKKMAISYFSLHELSSDISDNKVITGIRFQTTHGIIHAAIEQGKILAKDQIEQSTLSWKLPNFALEEQPQYFDPAQLVKLNYDFQTIHLDDVQQNEATSGSSQGRRSYVTGVRFRHHKDHLQLEVQWTDFDTESNTLNRKTSKWISTFDHHPTSRVTKIYNNTDDPMTNPNNKPSEPKSTDEETIQFSAADLKLTGGQVVVPYFDGQNTHPTKRVPLHGVGLFYKGQEGYGGFLAWRLFLIRSEEVAATK